MPIQPYQEDSEVSNPIKRIRWATHRVTGQKGEHKRQSLRERLKHKRTPSAEKELGKSPEDMQPGITEFHVDSEEEEASPGRTIYFNMPLPPQARDEEGKPSAHYARNKIRTAKYTPLSFVPKNLWFQFHNIANVYFLFIIILGVSQPDLDVRLAANDHYHSSFPFSAPPIQV